MPKPKKRRIVEHPPVAYQFKPQGIPARRLETIVMSLDEYEAIRLVDREKLDQREASERMGVSRPTCARIIESAHSKVAEALVEGKLLVIEGGPVDVRSNRYRCADCGAVWAIEMAQLPVDSPPACPSCGGKRIEDLGARGGWAGGGPGRGGPPWRGDGEHRGRRGGQQHG